MYTSEIELAQAYFRMYMREYMRLKRQSDPQGYCERQKLYIKKRKERDPEFDVKLKEYQRKYRASKKLQQQVNISV